MEGVYTSVTAVGVAASFGWIALTPVGAGILGAVGVGCLVYWAAN